MTSAEMYAAGYALPMMGVTSTHRPFRYKDELHIVPLDADIPMIEVESEVGPIRVALLVNVLKVAL